VNRHPLSAWWVVGFLVGRRRESDRAAEEKPRDSGKSGGVGRPETTGKNGIFRFWTLNRSFAMPRLTQDRVPRYRLHKQSGQASPYKLKSSRTKYDRLIAEWIAAGREPLHEARTADASAVNMPYTILNLNAA
jgi:hypothetical protein